MDALTVLQRTAAERDGIVTLAEARAAGLTLHEIRRLCRGGRWRVLARAGYLVDADLHGEVPRRAQIRAAITSFGPAAVAVLGTAAELHGIDGLPRTDEIHLSLPGPAARPARAAHPEVVVHQLTIDGTQLGSVSGIPVTTPLRTIADLILREQRFPAVSLLDSALNRQLVDPGEMSSLLPLIRGRRGALAARRHLAEADGRAQSPLETRTRLRCVDGKVPPETLQLEVRDAGGQLLGIGDLGWRRPRLIVEADGKGPHGTPEAVFADRRRQNRLVNAGWTVLRFTWADTRHPDYIPSTVRAALTAATRRDARSRRS